ncbi:putative RNA helicase [Medicago truncatula]|uniref:Putative RNA helicase n=1 Tax=Medicago truncatula TaxID=3880 RepID=A0A396I412_MEDTR|nr:putative RNA helicase [Medicago truncatula]
MFAKDDGFRDDSLRIIEKTQKFNSNCQVLFFSATLNDIVKNFVTRIVAKEHNEIFVKKEELPLKAVKQYKVHCPDELAKIEVIKDYIFKTGENRDKMVKEFKDGSTGVLISNDVLARGFDQDQVNLVINYDLPLNYTAEITCGGKPELDCEVYFHRVGRAGRFGRKGAVFNLICDERDEKLMSKIENHFGNHVTEVRQKCVEDYKDAFKKAGLLYRC